MNSIALLGGLGAGAGALYGLGDTHTNQYNRAYHKSTGYRGMQGGLSAAGGGAAYKLLRSSGMGMGKSGLLGLLSAGGIAALTNPVLSEQSFTRLPF